jgi:hypothetical protein
MKDDLDYFRELKALEEYRAIGTVEECKEAIERQTLKDVYVWANGSEHCPNCDFDITQRDFDDRFCCRCGQRYKAGEW